MKYIVVGLLIFSNALVAATTKTYPTLVLQNGRALKQVVVISVASETVMAKWEGGRGTIAIAQLPDDVRAEIELGRPAPRPETTTRTYLTFDQIVAGAPTMSPPPTFTTSSKTTAQAVTLTGQVFVTTQGGQNIKLGGVQVAVYPADLFSDFRRWRSEATSPVREYLGKAADQASSDGNHSLAIDLLELSIAGQYRSWDHLPPASSVATSDADGRFKLEHRVAGNYIVFAKAERSLGDKVERYRWAVLMDSSAGSKELLLYNANME